MEAYDYHRASSLDEVTDLLARYGDEAHLMAGGTSMVLMMKQGLIQPGHVIGLRDVSELQGIRPTEQGGLEIGATTTHRQAEKSRELRAYCPALAEAFHHVATVRIRNQATLGGNLAHADPAQDPPPMLLALDAVVRIRSASGERSLALSDFFKDYFETALDEGEVLTSVVLPPLEKGTRSAYLKFLPRTADDYATVSVAVSLRVGEDDRCEDVRIGLGSLGSTPLRARGLEAALQGQRLTADRIRELAPFVMEEVDPVDDVRGSAAYKRDMARVWVERALLRLVNTSTVN